MMWFLSSTDKERRTELKEGEVVRQVLLQTQVLSVSCLEREEGSFGKENGLFSSFPLMSSLLLLYFHYYYNGRQLII